VDEKNWDLLPLAFAGMPQRQQRELLAGLVGLDFNELNEQRLALYNERTIRNREIKGGDPTAYRKDPNAPLPLESLVGSMEKPVEGMSRQEISMAEELAKVEALEKKAAIHQEYERLKCKFGDARAECEKEIHDCESNIVQLKERIMEIERDIEATRGEIKIKEETIRHIEDGMNKIIEPEAISPEQISETRQQLLTIEEKNKQIREALKFDKAMEVLAAARKEVARLEEGMAKIDLEKQRRLNEAKFPIEGLGMTDEYVTFQDKSFSQLSTGEQVRISTAVAMALNPTLKIVLIREGSLLDKDGLKAVTDIAKQKDYQLWVERVSDEKGVGIYLEAGEIK
jgi:hypothetical protein